MTSEWEKKKGTMEQRGQLRSQCCTSKARITSSEVIKWPHTLVVYCNQRNLVGGEGKPKPLGVWPRQWEYTENNMSNPVTMVMQSALLLSDNHFRTCFPVGESSWMTYDSLGIEAKGNYRFKQFNRAASAQGRHFQVDCLFYEVRQQNTTDEPFPLRYNFSNHLHVAMITKSSDEGGDDKSGKSLEIPTTTTSDEDTVTDKSDRSEARQSLSEENDKTRHDSQDDVDDNSNDADNTEDEDHSMVYSSSDDTWSGSDKISAVQLTPKDETLQQLKVDSSAALKNKNKRKREKGWGWEYQKSTIKGTACDLCKKKIKKNEGMLTHDKASKTTGIRCHMRIKCLCELDENLLQKLVDWQHAEGKVVKKLQKDVRENFNLMHL